MRTYIYLIIVMLLAGCGGGSSSSDPQSSQKAWVRAHLDDVYLWYNEIVDVPPSSFATAPDYFNALLVRSKDRFSFSMPQAEAMSTLQQGMESGYGVKWGWGAPGRLFAYYVDPNSPAAVALTRGTEVTAINGQTPASMASAALSSALFPSQPGANITLTYRLPGTSSGQTLTMNSATFATTTVETPRIITLPDGRKAGYLLFNEHLATVEQALADSMSFFLQQGISEFVLDMRYNTGGYLYIAEEMASMIGGNNVQGGVFEKLVFNSKHPERTSNPYNTMYFSQLDSNDNQLPMLGLSRVFVLTGSNTCSASEAIINGLLPFMQVVRIGWTTCGKPYGFIQTNNDNQAYFAIQFEGINAIGTDNYKSGFAPTCQVSDDLNYLLGDSREARLKSALYYMSNESCPPATTINLPKAASSASIPVPGEAQMIGQKQGLKLLR